MKKNIECLRSSVETHLWKINFIALAARKAMIGPGAIILAISATGVSAQVAAPAAAASAPAAADSPLMLEQVVVTATRRTSTLQSVPGTIQSISSATLSELSVQTVSEVFGVDEHAPTRTARATEAIGRWKFMVSPGVNSKNVPIQARY